jgi:hypothetical protein
MLPPSQVGVTTVHVEPLPVTVKAPAPVLLTLIPVAAPLDEILRKVRPLAPMVVLATFSAVAVAVVRVLTMLVLFWVAVTVPPPVALKAVFVPVLALIPPLKLIVAPLLLVKVIPVSVSVTPPLKVTLPPVLLPTFTEWLLPLAMVPE